MKYSTKGGAETVSMTIQGEIGRRVGQSSVADLAKWMARTCLACIAAVVEAAQGADCAPIAGEIVSVQGRVEVRRAESGAWVKANFGDKMCKKDSIRVRARGRAAVYIPGQSAPIRLDANSALTLDASSSGAPFSIDLTRGQVHILTRTPSSFTVKTPFVTAAVKGTEFLVTVNDTTARVEVLEGVVRVENELGQLDLTASEGAAASKGTPPRKYTIVRPWNSVEWALYYPPLIYWNGSDNREVAGEVPIEKPSLESFRGASETQDEELDREGRSDLLPKAARLRNAAMALASGDLVRFHEQIAAARREMPSNGEILALESISLAAQAQLEGALEMAELAISVAPQSAAGYIAKTYALQGRGAIEIAAQAAREATQIESANAFAWTRRAELELSDGDRSSALRSARKAVQLLPDYGRAYAVLGFVQLRGRDFAESARQFGRAIELDQVDPLPRVGLALAEAGRDNLESARRNFEIALSLDPERSLTRSYLAKLYLEIGDLKRARDEISKAKELDANDPTPWLYDSILSRATNEPANALSAALKAEELNGNRLVYRSSLLLDEDLTFRGLSLSRAYADLGFNQLAVSRAAMSVEIDPTVGEAHRFLSDAYLGLPRHDIARVSEYLQASIRSPTGLAPVQPLLNQNKLLDVSRTLVQEIDHEDFPNKFSRNGVAATADATAGDNIGEQMSASLIGQRTVVSAAQLYDYSRGMHQNGDMTRNLSDVFLQANVTPDTHIQVEGRYSRLRRGDPGIHFDPTKFNDSRTSTAATVGRIGLYSKVSPSDEIIASCIYEHIPTWVVVPVTSLRQADGGSTGEIQYTRAGQRFRATIGAGYFSGRSGVDLDVNFAPGIQFKSSDVVDRSHRNAYLYSQWIVIPRVMDFVVGVSNDRLHETTGNVERWGPKFGVILSPSPETTIRVATFSGVKRTFSASQTLEPTQVAGFNQLFDDPNGSAPRRLGVGVDHSFANGVFAGLETSRRKLSYPVLGPFGDVEFYDRRESLQRAYLYFATSDRWALAIDYFREKIDDAVQEPFTKVTTETIPITASLFPSPRLSLFATLRGVRQSGIFNDAAMVSFAGKSAFAIVDLGISIRVFDRRGTLSVQARNLLDRRFSYEETDPASPRIAPKRWLFSRLSLEF